MKRILCIVVIITLFGCAPEPVFDCTEADRVQMDKYIRECTGGSYHREDCVRQVTKLYCKPVARKGE